MTLGLYESERRHRRRVWGGVIRIALFIILLIVASAFSYQYGIRQVESREDQLLQQVATLQSDKSALEQDSIRLQAAIRTVEIRYEELQRRFATEVPDGDLLRLTQLAAQRLGEGVDPERLAFFIQEAEEPRDCSRLDSRRFIMATPAYQGPNTSVAFDNGRITITGMGRNAVATNGGILGWFDTAEEVSLTFTVIGGDSTSVRGVLPLHQSVVLGNEEFSFAIVQGNRSFVRVTAERCGFP